MRSAIGEADEHQEFKASLHVSYYLYQAKTVTYDFISNSLEAEDASLVHHTPRGVVDVSTHCKKAPESDAKGAGGAIFTVFYPNWAKLPDGDKQSIFDEKDQLNIKGGGKCKSFRKKNRAFIKYKKKAAQKIQYEVSSLKPSVRNLKK